jgi:hypothetical protein
VGGAATAKGGGGEEEEEEEQLYSATASTGVSAAAVSLLAVCTTTALSSCGMSDDCAAVAAMPELTITAMAEETSTSWSWSSAAYSSSDIAMSPVASAWFIPWQTAIKYRSSATMRSASSPKEEVAAIDQRVSFVGEEDGYLWNDAVFWSPEWMDPSICRATKTYGNIAAGLKSLFHARTNC